MQSAEQTLQFPFTAFKNVKLAFEDDTASGCPMLENNPNCFKITDVITNKIYFISEETPNSPLRSLPHILGLFGHYGASNYHKEKGVMIQHRIYQQITSAYNSIRI